MPTYVFHSLTFANRDVGGISKPFKDGQLVTSDPKEVEKLEQLTDVILVETIPDDEPEVEVSVEAVEPSAQSEVPAKPRKPRKPRKRRVPKAPRKSVTVTRGLKGAGDGAVRAETEGVSQ